MSDEALKIKKLYEEMKLYNNPEELEKTRSMIRKNIPLTMRGYLLAYLYVKQNNNGNINGNGQVSLYMNIGIINNTNAKELESYITDNTGINADEIIKVIPKQTYSFINLSNREAAKTIIEKLNGREFNGRKIKVNYSR